MCAAASAVALSSGMLRVLCRLWPSSMRVCCSVSTMLVREGVGAWGRCTICMQLVECPDGAAQRGLIDSAAPTDSGAGALDAAENGLCRCSGAEGACDGVAVGSSAGSSSVAGASRRVSGRGEGGCEGGSEGPGSVVKVSWLRGVRSEAIAAAPARLFLCNICTVTAPSQRIAGLPQRTIRPTTACLLYDHNTAMQRARMF